MTLCARNIRNSSGRIIAERVSTISSLIFPYVDGCTRIFSHSSKLIAEAIRKINISMDVKTCELCISCHYFGIEFPWEIVRMYIRWRSFVLFVERSTSIAQHSMEVVRILRVVVNTRTREWRCHDDGDALTHWYSRLRTARCLLRPHPLFFNQSVCEGQSFRQLEDGWHTAILVYGYIVMFLATSICLVLFIFWC